MTISNGVTILTRGVCVAVFTAAFLFSSFATVFAAATPVANDDPSYITTEDSALVVPALTGVLFNDTDGDLDPLVAVLDADVTNGTLLLSADGSFTYTPDANWSGVDTFTYHADDLLDGPSAIATVTITVSAVDDTPTADADVYATNVNAPLAVPAAGVLIGDADVEGAVFATPAAGATTGGGTYALLADGSLTYTPALDFSGPDTFTYTATDGLLTSSPATVTITVSKLAQTITFADPANVTYGDATSVVVAPTASSLLAVSVSTSGACTNTGFTVNFSDAGTCTVTTSQSGDAVYAAAADVVESFSILPRAVTVTATASTKVYDTNTSSLGLPALTGTLGFLDTATYSQTYASEDVGVGITLTPASSLDANANYTVTHTTAVGDITPASLTATVAAGNKEYNGNTTTTATPSVTPLGGDTVGASYVAADFDTKDVGAGKTVTVTGIALTGADAGNYVLTSTSATDGADVTAKPLSVEVTVDNKVYDNTTSATITGYTPVGLVLLEVVTINGGTAVFASENVGTHAVSVTGLNLVVDSVSANYSFTSTDATTASVTARPITVTAQANSKVYDGLDTSATNAAVTSVTTLAVGDTATFTQSYDFVDVDTAIAMTPTATDVVSDDNGGANYTVTYTSANVGTITPAPLTITADDLTKVYGDANPVATATYTGFVVGEDETDLDTDVTLVIVANSQTDVNDHTITAFGAADSNYSITHENGNISITKRPITVTVTAASKVYDNTTATTATLAPVGVLFADTVTASHAGATFDTVTVGTGKTVTTAGVTLGGADAGNYSVATTATGTAAVTARPLSVSAVAGTKVYGGTDPTFGYTSNIVSGDSFSGVLARTSGEDVGTYAMNIGTLSAGSNYDTIVFTPANLSITQATLTVTADDNSKTYGAVNPALTVSYGAFQSGDDASDLDTAPTATTLAVTASGAGTWAITPAGGVDTNYAFSYVNGTLTINKADQTITFAALSNKNFGDADFAVSASSDSLLTVTYTATGACTVTSGSVHLTTKGLCTITAEQSGDTNWNAATSVSQGFTVVDNTIPVISLIGNATEPVVAGNGYTDAGASATDDVDGVITGSIVTVNPVDANTPATYTITYNVVDSSGNVAAQVTRTVVVEVRKSSGGSSSSKAFAPAPVGRVLGASSYRFSTELTLGAKGVDVNELQSMLIAGGFLKIAAPTGFFGPMTAAAVKLYQAAHSIPATGYVGPRTLALLNAAGLPAKTVNEQIAELMAKLKLLQAQAGQ